MHIELREKRDIITCNEREKEKLVESGYFKDLDVFIDSLTKKLQTINPDDKESIQILKDSDMEYYKAHIEIISILSSSHNKKIKNKIVAVLGDLFGIFKNFMLITIFNNDLNANDNFSRSDNLEAHNDLLRNIIQKSDHSLCVHEFFENELGNMDEKKNLDEGVEKVKMNNKNGQLKENKMCFNFNFQPSSTDSVSNTSSENQEVSMGNNPISSFLERMQNLRSGNSIIETNEQGMNTVNNSVNTIDDTAENFQSLSINSTVSIEQARNLENNSNILNENLVQDIQPDVLVNNQETPVTENLGITNNEPRHPLSDFPEISETRHILAQARRNLNSIHNNNNMRNDIVQRLTRRINSYLGVQNFNNMQNTNNNYIPGHMIRVRERSSSEREFEQTNANTSRNINLEEQENTASDDAEHDDNNAIDYTQNGDNRYYISRGYSNTENESNRNSRVTIQEFRRRGERVGSENGISELNNIIQLIDAQDCNDEKISSKDKDSSQNSASIRVSDKVQNLNDDDSSEFLNSKNKENLETEFKNSKKIYNITIYETNEDFYINKIDHKKLSNKDQVFNEGFSLIVRYFSYIYDNIKKEVIDEEDFLFTLIWILKQKSFRFSCMKYEKDFRYETIKLLISTTRKKKFYNYLCCLKLLKNMFINETTFPLYKSLTNRSSYKIIEMAKLVKIYKTSTSSFKTQIVDFHVKYMKYNTENKTKHYRYIIRCISENFDFNKEKYLVILGKLTYECEEVQIICLKHGLTERVIKTFKNSYLRNEKLDSVLFCLGSLATCWEENRKKILKSGIIKLLFSLYKEKISNKEFDKCFLMIQFLIKTMTRCVTFVRSELIHYPIIELSLITLTYLKKIKRTKDIDIDEAININANITEKNHIFTLCIIKEIFSILSNLVLEFGNYKVIFQNQNGINIITKLGKKKNIELNLLFLLKNYVYDSTWRLKDKLLSIFGQENNIKDGKKNFYYFKNTARDRHYNLKRKLEKTEKTITNKNKGKNDHNTKKSVDFNDYTYSEYSKSSSFLSEQNFSFKNDNDQIEYMLENDIIILASRQNNTFYYIMRKYRSINFLTINKKSLRALKTLKEYFNLLRNLLCGSLTEINCFFARFPKILENTFIFLYWILEGESHHEKNKVLIQIMYMLVNITSIGKKYRKYFLSEKLIDLVVQTSKIKDKDLNLATIWLLINLTSKEDNESFIRVKTLNKKGIKEWLFKMQSSEHVINEKICTALKNLEFKEKKNLK